MDLSGEKVPPGSASNSSGDREECSGSGDGGGGAKSCADCRTTKTPLWRGGPSGPKSLCNACGIKYRKRRRVVIGLDSTTMEKKKGGAGGSGKVEFALKFKVVGFRCRRRRSATAAVVVRDRSPPRWRFGKMREEEEAAFLLMALSSGFF